MLPLPLLIYCSETLFPVPKLDRYLLCHCYLPSSEYVGSEQESKRYRCQDRPTNTGKVYLLPILAAELVCAPEWINNKLRGNTFMYRSICTDTFRIITKERLRRVSEYNKVIIGNGIIDARQQCYRRNMQIMPIGWHQKLALKFSDKTLHRKHVGARCLYDTEKLDFGVYKEIQSPKYNTRPGSYLHAQFGNIQSVRTSEIVFLVDSEI